jgi:hypothetical protein
MGKYLTTLVRAPVQRIGVPAEVRARDGNRADSRGDRLGGLLHEYYLAAV